MGNKESLTTDLEDHKQEIDHDKQKRIILSPIITEKDVNDWRYRGLLIPHEVIRHGLNTLIKLTNYKYYQLSNKNDIIKLEHKINKFYTWYTNYFYFFVHHHHNAEENFYFKWIIKRCDNMPSKISKDHKTLIQMLNDIKLFQNKFNYIFETEVDIDINFYKQLEQLHTLCGQLKQHMIQHLNEEEECVPMLFKKYKVTEEEELEVVKKISFDLGLSGNKIMMPWIIDVMYLWGGLQIVNEFKQNIPLPVKLINYVNWTNDYENNNKNVVKEIISD
eukprot:381771_1